MQAKKPPSSARHDSEKPGSKEEHRHKLEAAYERLARDGLIRFGKHGPETGKRWQGAIMRAAADLIKKGDEGKDVRVPIVHALLSIYGSRLSDEELSDYVLVLMEVESQWLEKIRRQQGTFSHH